MWCPRCDEQPAQELHSKAAGRALEKVWDASCLILAPILESSCSSYHECFQSHVAAFDFPVGNVRRFLGPANSIHLHPFWQFKMVFLSKIVSPAFVLICLCLATFVHLISCRSYVSIVTSSWSGRPSVLPHKEFCHHMFVPLCGVSLLENDEQGVVAVVPGET